MQRHRPNPKMERRRTLELRLVGPKDRKRRMDGNSDVLTFTVHQAVNALLRRANDTADLKGSGMANLGKLTLNLVRVSRALVRSCTPVTGNWGLF